MVSVVKIATVIVLIIITTILLCATIILHFSLLEKGETDDGKYDTLGLSHVSVDPDNRTENGDYVLKVVYCDWPKLGVEGLRFTLFSPDRHDMSNRQHRVSNVYGKPIDDQTFISFRDGDHNGKLSIGDLFIIKSFEHVDDDGSTDFPGFAKPGFVFELRAGRILLFEELIT